MFQPAVSATPPPPSPPIPDQSPNVRIIAVSVFSGCTQWAARQMGVRMETGRRPEQIFPALPPPPFFFSFSFSLCLFLSFSFFFLSSVCPSLPTDCPIWPSLPSVFCFPILPHGASRHLGSTATEKLVRTRKKS